MDLLVNDLSFHGQFRDLASFRGAIGTLMAIREIARRFGRTMYSHRNIAQALVTPTMPMPQAVQGLTHEERRAVLQWLTQYGPFWEDARHHQPEDWLECNGDIVTDTAVGEAAWCCLNGIDRGLVSLTPSNWNFSPVSVDSVSDSGEKRAVGVTNHWDSAKVETVLQGAPLPLSSWQQLETLAKVRCTEVTFATNAYNPLIGYPFISSAAQRVLIILETLNRFKSCFDERGERTPEGHRMYQEFFTGKKGSGGRGALFSDSSDTEKIKFKAELTFKHPADTSKTLFCPMHGKIQTPPLRVHFSSPIRSDEPLYVVYIGPKITKQ